MLKHAEANERMRLNSKLQLEHASFFFAEESARFFILCLAHFCVLLPKVRRCQKSSADVTESFPLLPWLVLVVVANRTSTDPDVLVSSVRNAASYIAMDPCGNLLRHTAHILLHPRDRGPAHAGFFLLRPGDLERSTLRRKRSRSFTSSSMGVSSSNSSRSMFCRSGPSP